MDKKDKQITIKLTKHASIKIAQRKISIEDIKQVILKPELSEPDKFDTFLMHYIGTIRSKFLRVIGRWEDKEIFIIVSAFFDRRLKGKL
jgi:hypothetical protein